MQPLVDQPPAPHLADFIDAIGELIAPILDVDARLREREVAAIDIGDGVYLGRREHGGLLYAGKVERGFTEDAKQRLIKLAKRLKSKAATLKIKSRKRLG